MFLLIYVTVNIKTVIM